MDMDYAKLDAPLAAALNQVESDPAVRLRVSLRTQGPPGPVEQKELCALGIQGVEAGRSIFSASLAPDDLETLTKKPYVRLISLAQVMRPCKDQAPTR